MRNRFTNLCFWSRMVSLLPSTVHSTQPSRTSKGVRGTTPRSTSGRRNPPPPAEILTEKRPSSGSVQASIPSCDITVACRSSLLQHRAVPRPLLNGMCCSIRSVAEGWSLVTSPAQCPWGRRTSMRSCWAMVVPRGYMGHRCSLRTTRFVETSISSLKVVAWGVLEHNTGEITVANPGGSKHSILALAEILRFPQSFQIVVHHGLSTCLFFRRSKHEPSLKDSTNASNSRGGYDAFWSCSDAHEHVKRPVVFCGPNGAGYIAIPEEMKLRSCCSNVLEQISVTFSVSATMRTSLALQSSTCMACSML